MEALRILIGRNKKCDYVIENPQLHMTVSGAHATISETERPDMFLFEDHSTNGSYINGRLLHNDSCMVGIYDKIILGKTYILPFEDIVKRYLSNSRETKKKPVSSQDNNDCNIKSYVETDLYAGMVENDTLKSSKESVCNYNVGEQASENIGTSQTFILPDVSSNHTEEKKGIPFWFWLVFAGTLVTGIVIGMFLYYYLYGN